MRLKKYEMLSGSYIEPSAKAGTIVYEAAKHDYGLGRDDTNMTGIPHISVTLNENGDYPFFTHPEHMLKEIKD